MRDVILRWWHKQNVRWSRGGGYTAARLWWVFFALLAGTVATSPLFYSMPYSRLGEKRLRNLRQIGLALATYTEEHDDRLPPMEDVASLRRALTPYLPEDAPEDVWQPAGLNAVYVVNTALSRQPLTAHKRPGTTVTIWDARVQNGGHTVLFLDTHVKYIPQSQWEGLRFASGIARDVPVPPLSWWSTRTPDDFRSYATGMALVTAVVAAFAAAWREAWCRVRRQGSATWFRFTGRFLLRFFGYGFCVSVAALVVALLLGNLIALTRPQRW